MGGFSSITGDETIMNADNASFDGTERGGKMTTNGQLWIGATASPHVRLGSLASAGSTVTITTGAGTINLEAGATVPTTFVGNSGSAVPAANSLNVIGSGIVTVTGSGSTLTINVPGSGFTWTDQAGTFTAVKNNGYFCTAALTVNLPAAPVQGDSVQVYADTTSAVTIKASGTQIIRYSSAVSAAAGTAATTARGDSVELIYRAANTEWCAVDFVGNWTIT